MQFKSLCPARHTCIYYDFSTNLVTNHFSYRKVIFISFFGDIFTFSMLGLLVQKFLVSLTRFRSTWLPHFTFDESFFSTLIHWGRFVILVYIYCQQCTLFLVLFCILNDIVNRNVFFIIINDLLMHLIIIFAPFQGFFVTKEVYHASYVP